MKLPYIGRFAPSPSGPLHAGSVVAALASYVDARAWGGQWRVRIEDIDTPRTVAGADRVILQQLHALGMQPDGPVWWQSQRFAVYQAVFNRLQQAGMVYGCACTRKELQAAGSGTGAAEQPYPGTCRHGLAAGRSARAWRLRMPPGMITFTDRWQGWQSQDVAATVGDMVLRRADGLWAYQLAVVIDDLAQGITQVVRGNDLLSSSARQLQLRARLGQSARDIHGLWPEPELTACLMPDNSLWPLGLMHVPLVCGADGRKLSKQNGAPAANTRQALQTLQLAWQALGFDALAVQTVAEFHAATLAPWRERFKLAASSP